MAVSGVFSDGFQMQALPQTRASAAFHDQTATGKLKAVMMPVTPKRMPGLHHAMVRALGGDGEAEDLAREADRVVADVDHLLHFAQALAHDLADLDRDQAAERGLMGAQLFAQQPHQLAALGRRHIAPGEERLVRVLDGLGRLGGGGGMHLGDHLAGDRRMHVHIAAGVLLAAQPQLLQQGVGLFDHMRSGDLGGHGKVLEWIGLAVW